MNKVPEIKKLVDLLSTERPETEITFREESAREIRYALVFGTDDSALLCRLARIFGCPDQLLPSSRETQIEASDEWHGRGKVNLRNLADELIATYGECFDFDATLAELRALAHTA